MADEDYQSMTQFLKEVRELSQSNFQLYEYIGRLLFIGYRHSFFVENFHFASGGLLFNFYNGEHGEHHRYVRFEISI